MKRLGSVLGFLGALSVGCGNGDDNAGKMSNSDSGSPDATVEGGQADGGSDSTADSPGESSAAEAGEAEAGNDGGNASEGGGPSCMTVDAGALDDAAVSAGLQFILSTGHCNHCHQTNPDAGLTLSGDNSSITDAGPVFPPNLTPDPATGLGCWTNDQIANAILFGVDPTTDGGLLCHLMPQFGVPKGDAAALLDDASIGNVVEALRSLAPISNLVPTTICPGSSPSASADAGDAGTPDAGDAAGD